MTEQMTRPDETTPDARRLPLPVPRNAQGTLPLSSLQEQLWFLDRLAPGVRAYNVARAFPAPGDRGTRAAPGATRAAAFRHGSVAREAEAASAPASPRRVASSAQSLGPPDHCGGVVL